MFLPTILTPTPTIKMTQSSYDSLVKGLTTKDILEQFPDVTPIVTDVKAPSSKPGSANSEDDHHTLFQGQDAEQIKLMEEVCIVVDYNDTPVGAGSKKTCKLFLSLFSTNVQVNNVTILHAFTYPKKGGDE